MLRYCLFYAVRAPTIPGKSSVTGPLPYPPGRIRVPWRSRGVRQASRWFGLNVRFRPDYVRCTRKEPTFRQ